MAHSLPGLNREMLRWARERAGLSVEALAAAIKQDPSVVEEWESGATAPTYPQLETLAYRVLKRPVALFFFPEPPEESEPQEWFRTLPDVEIDELLPDTRYRIREARSQQLALSELTNGHNPAERHVLRDLSPSKSAKSTAAALREYLGVTLDVQTKRWRSSDTALKEWRSRIEAAGVFVFKHSFKQRDVSGFSLFDSEFPLIVINNSTAPTRQTFTLLHELAHLLVQVGGVTKRDDGFINLLDGERQRLEVYCNRLAAYSLIPPGVAEDAAASLGVGDEAVAEVAGQLKVSREAVLRRLLEAGLVSQQHYESRARAWTNEYFAKKPGRPGGNYFLTQATYLSPRFTQLAFSTFYSGDISLQQLADYLNVRVKNVHGLEELLLQKAAG